MRSAIEVAIADVGSQGAVARALGITRQAVTFWVRTGRLPAERAIELEELTEGRVTREMLRPDLFAPARKYKNG